MSLQWRIEQQIRRELRDKHTPQKEPKGLHVALSQPVEQAATQIEAVKDSEEREIKKKPEMNLGEMKLLQKLRKLTMASDVDDTELKSIAQSLVKKGFKTESLKDKYKALQWAAESGHYHFARLLILNGHFRQTSPEFIENKDPDSNRQRHNLVNLTPFQLASREGHIDILHLILSHRQSMIDKVSNHIALSYAIYGRHLDVVKLLVEDDRVPIDLNIVGSSGLTDLQIAVEQASTGMVESVLSDSKAILNFVGIGSSGPLHMAAESGNIEILKILLAHPGIDPNDRDSNGSTPLIKAAENKHMDTVQILLDQGADINPSNDAGDTPLLRALQKGNLPLSQLFLDRPDLNVNATNAQGWTALMYAASYGCTISVSKLLKYGNIDVKYRVRTTELQWGSLPVTQYRSAFDISTANGFRHVEQLLSFFNDSAMSNEEVLGNVDYGYCSWGRRRRRSSPNVNDYRVESVGIQELNNKCFYDPHITENPGLESQEAFNYLPGNEYLDHNSAISVNEGAQATSYSTSAYSVAQGSSVYYSSTLGNGYTTTATTEWDNYTTTPTTIEWDNYTTTPTTTEWDNYTAPVISHLTSSTIKSSLTIHNDITTTTVNTINGAQESILPTGINNQPSVLTQGSKTHPLSTLLKSTGYLSNDVSTMNSSSVSSSVTTQIQTQTHTMQAVNKNDAINWAIAVPATAAGVVTTSLAAWALKLQREGAYKADETARILESLDRNLISILSVVRVAKGLITREQTTNVPGEDEEEDNDDGSDSGSGGESGAAVLQALQHVVSSMEEFTAQVESPNLPSIIDENCHDSYSNYTCEDHGIHPDEVRNQIESLKLVHHRHQVEPNSPHKVISSSLPGTNVETDEFSMENKEIESGLRYDSGFKNWNNLELSDEDNDSFNSLHEQISQDPEWLDY